MKKLNYNWSEQQLLELDECRKKASEIARYLETLSWLFECNSEEESIIIEQTIMAEKIEIFCENQLPF